MVNCSGKKNSCLFIWEILGLYAFFLIQFWLLWCSKSRWIGLQVSVPGRVPAVKNHCIRQHPWTSAQKQSENWRNLHNLKLKTCWTNMRLGRVLLFEESVARITSWAHTKYLAKGIFKIWNIVWCCHWSKRDMSVWTCKVILMAKDEDAMRQLESMNLISMSNIVYLIQSIYHLQSFE